jgi:hypothetical protein
MAEGFLRPPPPFRQTGADADSHSQWDRWVEQYEFYMKATEKDKKSKAIQVATLVTLLGEEGFEIYRSFEWESDTDKDDIAKVKTKFKEYYTPRTNVIYERYKFLKRKQEKGESFDSFLTALMNLSANCNYAAERHNIVRDQLVIGIESDSVRQDLLYEIDLTLEKAVAICRNKEATAQFAEHMGAHSNSSFRPSSSNTGGGEVHAVGGRPTNNNNSRPKAKFNNTQKKSGPTNRSKPGSTFDHHKKQGPCRNCSYTHAPRKCPAFGKQCRKCGNYNHFAKCCRSQNKTDTVTVARQEHSFEEENTDIMFSYALTSNHTSRKKREWFIGVLIDGKRVKVKVDTGAFCNVMSEKTFRVIGNLKLQKTKEGLASYSGHKMTVVGSTHTVMEFGNKYYPQTFIVVAEDRPTLLGLPGSQELGLVTVRHTADSISKSDGAGGAGMLSTYADVFEGVGLLPGEHHITLKEDATPAVYSARRVPLRLRDQLKRQLDEMVKNGSIEKVTRPTEWVNPLVIVRKKDNSLRICLDPGPLNGAVKREHYSLPTAEDIFSKLHGSRFFTTLDATTGFMQLALDEASSHLTTFATPFGRYRFRRLPYGITSAPEVFHRTMVEHFNDINGVEIFIDDLIVYGTTEDEHDSRLKQVLDRCREINLKLNPQKMRFKCDEVTYLGHVISAEGLKADPRKVEAILNMPQPEDKEAVRRLLGMTTYLAKFCPHLSDLTAPLRDLIKKDNEWVWDAQHTDCLTKIKEAVSAPTVLKLFDPKEPVVLSVDASQKGLGALIMQAGQPVEYASCTLSDTQQRYAQIEKEFLAIQFGVTRYHQYVYGQTFTVETDHKPLLGIMKRPIADLSPRLQRMRLRCDPYDINLVYKPGKDLIMADFLSRAQQVHIGVTTDTLDTEAIHAVSRYTMANEMSRQQIKNATGADVTLQLLLKVMREGWPSHKKLCPGPLKCFWSVRTDLTEYDGVVYKGEQVVVPTCLRRSAIQNVHEGHFGIVKCIQRAKTSMYWPGYIQDITDCVESCSKCQENRNQNPATMLQHHEVPEYPFQVVATDIFELNGSHYLLTVDYYSRWVNVVKVSDITSSTLIEEFEKQFCDFGIPEVLISDNGPQYCSQQFKDCMQRLHVEHLTSSPYYAQSNGMAERAVGTVKASLKKTLSEGKSLLHALATIRSTPLSADLPSPAVLSQGRNIRCHLHQLTHTLQHQNLDARAIRQKLQARQAVNSHYHDSHKGTSKSTLSPGSVVRTRRAGQWIPARVQSHDKAPQSYWLELANGAVVRRNRRQINTTAENLEWSSVSSVPCLVRQNCPSDKTPSISSRVSDAPGNPPATGATRDTNTSDVQTSRAGRPIRKPARYRD